MREEPGRGGGQSLSGVRLPDTADSGSGRSQRTARFLLRLADTGARLHLRERAAALAPPLLPPFTPHPPTSITSTVVLVCVLESQRR